MSPFERRTRTAQDSLKAGQTIVLFPSPNLYYLTGVWETPSERHLFAFIGVDGEPVMVVPELSVARVRSETWVEDVRAWADGDDPMDVVETALTDRGLEDSEFRLDPTMWARFTHDLRERLPEASFGLATALMEELRVQKDDTEVAALRRVADLTDAVSVEIRRLGEKAIGMTEAEVAQEIGDRLADRGGTGVSFETIVGAGPNGAHPHHTHGDRVIDAGDPVVLDFGTTVDHYPSDQTRTVVFAGDPGDRFRDVHAAVTEAQAAAVDAVEPGVEAGAVDAAARTVLGDRGYGDQFIHRTGHGVGLEVHEAPFIVAGNDRELEPGMVFSVEPGVYIEDAFGVRIEDLVVVTDDGCERLNTSPRGWQAPP